MGAERPRSLYPVPVPHLFDRPRDDGDDSSFARGLRLLRSVAERPGARADELAAQLGMPVSTVYRYLRTLTDTGFVERRGGTYHLDPSILIGGGANVTSALLVAAAGPVLASLAERAGETALLVRRVGTAVVCLDVTEPSRPLRVVATPGDVSPLVGGVVGHILLAFAPPEVVDGTPGTTRAIRAELARIAAAGAGIGEESVPDPVVTVAVPIIRADGIAGALALRGPAGRCDGAWRERAVGLLREGAHAIVEAVGQAG